MPVTRASAAGERLAPEFRGAGRAGVILALLHSGELCVPRACGGPGGTLGAYAEAGRAAASPSSPEGEAWAAGPQQLEPGLRPSSLPAAPTGLLCSQGDRLGGRSRPSHTLLEGSCAAQGGPCAAAQPWQGLGERKGSSPYLHFLLHLGHLSLQGTPLLWRDKDAAEHLGGSEGSPHATPRRCDPPP